jgi:integrase
MMNAEPVTWSEEKQKRLQGHLVGMWAEDIWELNDKRGTHRKRYARFALVSSSLKTELKYAFWHKFDSGAWDVQGAHGRLASELKVLVAWFNQVTRTVSSLMEKPLEHWEWSLRSYLVETHQLKRYPDRILGTQQAYVACLTEDSRILLLRQCYKIVASAYDEREATEKDIWDMRELGLDVNLTENSFFLNFALIAQPWLKQLAKEFMKYNMAIHSAGDCRGKLGAVRDFSRFLTASFPHCRISDIDRPLMVKYVHDLRERHNSVGWRNHTLSALRTFFATCAHRLHQPDLTKEHLIFAEDFLNEPYSSSREVPEEVLEQLRTSLDALPTTILRMVTILLEVGLRINELCSLPLDGLIHDDRHEWYLRFYQRKTHQEHIIPLVDEQVVGAIQAQQQEMRERWGHACQYLFPSAHSHLLPYKQGTFRQKLNEWAMKHQIKDRTGKLYHFTAHPFRHSLGMRLINQDVPLEVISRLLGHRSLRMTQVYARVRDKKLRADLERVALTRKTVNAQGQAVKGDARANDLEAQMVRRGMRGQTLPVGGCGRLVVLGDCAHANKCLTCPMWLTSMEDLPKLKSFYERAVRLKQRASDVGNHFVIEQQERIIANLAVRIKSLEATEMDGKLVVDEVLGQLQTDLVEAECALEEVRDNGLIPAAKYLERTIVDLKARIAALEEPA